MNGLDLGKDIVQKVRALDGRRERKWVVATGCYDGDGNPLFITGNGIIVERFGDNHHGRRDAESRVEPDLTGATREMEADIGLLELVDAQRFIQRVSDLVEPHGKLQGYGIGGVLQTGEVPLEEKEHPPYARMVS